MRPEVTAFYGETSVESSRSILSTPSFWLSFDWESITTVAFNGWIAVGETVVLLTSPLHPIHNAQLKHLLEGGASE